MFEEEFSACDEHIDFVGGSTNSVTACNCTTNSIALYFPADPGEDPVSYTTAERPEK